METFSQQKKFISEWYIQYVTHRDIMHKKIRSITQEKGYPVIDYQDKTEKAVSQPILGDFSYLSTIKADEHVTIITFNMKENVNDLLESWKLLKEYKNLKVIFINPHSTTEHKWIICPHVHDKFCDKESLSQGILTLFESTDELKREDIVQFEPAVN